MKIYNLWIDEYDYEEHDSFVVIAKDLENAFKLTGWTDDGDVHVQFIGYALFNETEERIVCDSFNAG